MDGKKLYEIGMAEYDKKNFKAAAENLELSAKAGFQSAFGILYTLYTTPNEFKETHKEFRELVSVLKEYAVEHKNVLAALFLAINTGSEEELDNALETAEKESESMHGNKHQLLGPTYIQVGLAYTQKNAPKSKREACLEGLRGYANKVGAQQLLDMLPMIASQFGV